MSMTRYIIILIIISLLLCTIICSNAESLTSPTNINNRVTVRVNTFRRLDLLDYFLEYYKECEVIRSIQVVWSDVENQIPKEITSKYSNNDYYIYEIHKKNSLNNRFRPLEDIYTEAVLSIDDDLIIPCKNIEIAFNIWKSNKKALVGFSPRMHTYDIETGNLKYMKWQHTWWSGIYTIMLTKAAILHKDYLYEYDKLIPTSITDHIDKMRNCEDIAMAYVVAEKSGVAPVWVQVPVYEVSVGGISSGSSHFDIRSECLTMLHEKLPTWPWITGYSKYTPLSILDWYRNYWKDNK